MDVISGVVINKVMLSIKITAVFSTQMQRGSAPFRSKH